MNKLKIFGSNLAILLIVSTIIGLGALVNYISNTITYQATLESPLNLHDLTFNGNSYDGSAVTIYGGSTVTLGYKVDNYANNPVDGTHEITICAESSNLDGSEITDISFIFDGTTYSSTDITNTTTTCSNGNTGLVFTSPTVTHSALTNDTNVEWDITFNSATQSDNYTFLVVVRPS